MKKKLIILTIFFLNNSLFSMKNNDKPWENTDNLNSIFSETKLPKEIQNLVKEYTQGWSLYILLPARVRHATSPDNKFAASATDNAVEIYDNSSKLHTLTSNDLQIINGRINSIGFSSDNLQLAVNIINKHVTSKEYVITIWDIKNFKLITRIIDGYLQFSNSKFSNDGNYYAKGDDFSNIKIYHYEGIERAS